MHWSLRRRIGCKKHAVSAEVSGRITQGPGGKGVLTFCSTNKCRSLGIGTHIHTHSCWSVRMQCQRPNGNLTLRSGCPGGPWRWKQKKIGKLFLKKYCPLHHKKTHTPRHTLARHSVLHLFEKSATMIHVRSAGEQPWRGITHRGLKKCLCVFTN